MKLFLRKGRRLAISGRRFLRSENGAALIEYTLLLGLVAFAIVATILLIRGDIVTIWDAVQKGMANAASSP